jgi:hypothetical protein
VERASLRRVSSDYRRYNCLLASDPPELSGVHFHPAAQRALPAINIGLWGEVGELNGQRLALLRRIERANGTEVTEPFLWKTLLPRVAKELKSD